MASLLTRLWAARGVEPQVATEVDAMLALLAEEREAIVGLDPLRIDAAARDKQALAQRIVKKGVKIGKEDSQRLSQALRRNSRRRR